MTRTLTLNDLAARGKVYNFKCYGAGDSKIVIAKEVQA